MTILEKGGELVHKKRFNNTGIKEILEAAGVPKGSFYHYFESKEAFGLGLLDYYSGFFVSKAEECPTDSSVSPMERLKKLFDHFLSLFESCGCSMGCPIGNLAQEMGDLSETFRIRLEEIFLMMKASIVKVLTEAKQAGELADTIDVAASADFIINSWEGAITRMKVQKSIEPLKLFDRMIFECILKQPSKEE